MRKCAVTRKARDLPASSLTLRADCRPSVCRDRIVGKNDVLVEHLLKLFQALLAPVVEAGPFLDYAGRGRIGAR